LKSVTSALQVVDGSVADGCVTGLDVQERLVAHAHRHHLLQTQLYEEEGSGGEETTRRSQEMKKEIMRSQEVRRP